MKTSIKTETKPFSDEETPEQAAETISDALDFLQGEATTAGLTEVSELIGQASAKARGESASSSASGGHAAALASVCEAVVALPAEYRNALIFRKVYRHSYAEIAARYSVSVDTAKARVMKGFQLVRGSLRPAAAR